MTFGEKLQGLRQKAGMSQEALAEKLNVSRQAVSRWERDETMPESDKVVSLADLCDVTTDYLLRQQVEDKTEEKAEPFRDGQNHDWGVKLAYLARTKGYLLGWLLIVWGAMDLLGLLATVLMLNGFFSFSLNAEIDHIRRRVTDMSSVAGMVTGILWLPLLYGIVKIVAGVLVLRYGKQYADRVKEEETL